MEASNSYVAKITMLDKTNVFIGCNRFDLKEGVYEIIGVPNEIQPDNYVGKGYDVVLAYFSSRIVDSVILTSITNENGKGNCI